MARSNEEGVNCIKRCLFQHLFRFVSPQDFYRRADIGIIQIHIQNENDVLDVVGHPLDGGTVFGNLGPEAGDIPPDDGKDHQDKSQHNPLKIFHLKIDALRPEDMQLDDNASIGQQGENADIQKTSGIEAEDAEEEDNDVNQQQDTACLIGKIHSIHHQNDGGTHLDNCQAGIGHLHIQTRAEEYIQGNVDDG